jgi:hypothetical protein
MNIMDSIMKHSESRVIGGPFQGMFIDPTLISWGEGDLPRKLLGVYEQELHPLIQQIIQEKIKRIVNVGHAEGYYAVGLARAMPESEVIAVDICKKAKNATRINAEANGVKVTVADQLPQKKQGDVWIIDIEGGELGLLKEPTEWAGVSILVELHEWVDRNMKEKFTETYKRSHKIEIIDSGWRNPNKFDFLAKFSDDERWSVVSEKRPERMRWLWMRHN